LNQKLRLFQAKTFTEKYIFFFLYFRFVNFIIFLQRILSSLVATVGLIRTLFLLLVRILHLLSLSFHKQELCGFELCLSVLYCYVSLRPTAIAVEILRRPLALCSRY
jgi:hypothetical protein